MHARVDRGVQPRGARGPRAAGGKQRMRIIAAAARSAAARPKPVYVRGRQGRSNPGAEGGCKELLCGRAWAPHPLRGRPFRTAAAALLCGVPACGRGRRARSQSLRL
jgi:hypothetical protein